MPELVLQVVAVLTMLALEALAVALVVAPGAVWRRPDATRAWRRCRPPGADGGGRRSRLTGRYPKGVSSSSRVEIPHATRTVLGVWCARLQRRLACSVDACPRCETELPRREIWQRGPLSLGLRASFLPEWLEPRPGGRDGER